ncbi:GNAT family N-acetyltransferase [Sphingomonas mesophila]|uniref:GNAT family N-acetyltransferase n=1 Tax=Sphingomonas mesophila TaxID=2303576 RepID=UPI000E58B8DB|nr:GNAT family N-acetyltransferase [Sphingomonas mesophila]
MAARAEPKQFAIALGGPADLDDVMQVMSAAFSSEFGEGWSRSQCGGILPLSGVRLVVARDGDGAPAGFTLERAVADEAELLLLAVAPRFQSCGLGSALLEQFIAAHAGGRITRLHLEVRDGNRAVGIYARAGFTPAGRRKDYYRGRDGSRHDAITMVRER